MEFVHVLSAVFYKPKRGGVHAVSQPGGLGSIVEDVPQVSSALGAGDGGANDSEARVVRFGDVFWSNRRPEAGPSSSGIEFGRRVEQRIIAADAAINSPVVQIPVLSRKGHFSIGIAGDVVDISRQLLPPFVGRFHHLTDAHSPQPFAGIGE